MNAQVKEQEQSQILKGLKPNQMVIEGRISRVTAPQPNDPDGNYYTHVMLPAPDPFTRPQMVMIQSKRSLGGAGNDLQILATPQGYERNFEKKDNTIGYTVEMRFLVK